MEHAQRVPWLGQLVRAVRTESPQWLRTRAGAALAYTVHTHRTSYFKLDDLGNLELRGGFPYRAEGPYQFQRTIRPEETAIVVMDPWVDGPSQHLTDYLGQIAYLRMIPLVMQASSRGHLIVILTNDPKTVTYGSKVYPELEQLAAKGKAVMWYHRQVDNRAFASYLRSHGVRSLIYVGFSSNGCVIGREDGMISMKNQGFTLYFVPEASAAMEYESSWNDQGIHKTTTLIISQGIAEIIDYGEFMRSSN